MGKWTWTINCRASKLKLFHSRISGQFSCTVALGCQQRQDVNKDDTGRGLALSRTTQSQGVVAE